MEMGRIAKNILVFVALVGIGMTRRCYEGLHGFATTEKECQGSCMTVKTDNLTAVSCDNFTIGAGCMTVESVHMCFCNDDLCNDGSTPDFNTTSVTFKCYEGLQGLSIQEVDCEGSCMAVRTSQNDVTVDYVGCIPSIRGDVCFRAYGATTCLCGSSLCNNGSIPELPSAPSRPTNPSSGGGSGSPFPGTGASIKCQFGEEGGKITEVDCGGSCMTIETTANGKEATVYGCSPFPSEETCVTLGKLKTCACNSNLCNQKRNSGMRTHLSFIYLIICFVVAKAFASA